MEREGRRRKRKRERSEKRKESKKRKEKKRKRKERERERERGRESGGKERRKGPLMSLREILLGLEAPITVDPRVPLEEGIGFGVSELEDPCWRLGFSEFPEFPNSEGIAST